MTDALADAVRNSTKQLAAGATSSPLRGAVSLLLPAGLLAATLRCEARAEGQEEPPEIEIARDASDPPVIMSEDLAGCNSLQHTCTYFFDRAKKVFEKSQ